MKKIDVCFALVVLAVISVGIAVLSTDILRDDIKADEERDSVTTVIPAEGLNRGCTKSTGDEKEFFLIPMWPGSSTYVAVDGETYEAGRAAGRFR